MEEPPQITATKRCSTLLVEVQPSWFGAESLGQRFYMAAGKSSCCSSELQAFPFPLPGWLLNLILYLRQPAPSARTQPGLSQRGWRAPEVGARTGAERHLCHGALLPALTLGLLFFPPGKQMNFLLLARRLKLPVERAECHCHPHSGRL